MEGGFWPLDNLGPRREISAASRAKAERIPQSEKTREIRGVLGWAVLGGCGAGRAGSGQRGERRRGLRRRGRLGWGPGLGGAVQAAVSALPGGAPRPGRPSE